MSRDPVMLEITGRDGARLLITLEPRGRVRVSGRSQGERANQPVDVTVDPAELIGAVARVAGLEVGPFVDLAGLAELAELTLSTVRSYRHRGMLPEPAVVFGGAQVWRVADVAQWVEQRP